MSADQPPEEPREPGPSGELPAPGRDPRDPVPAPPDPYTTGAVDPYGTAAGNPYEEPGAGIQWWLVLIGLPIGFVAWVVGSFLVLAATGTLAGTSGGNVLALVLLALLLLASVGLIVWRRTRRLAQGFVLGAAIGLVVAGGLCIPLVSSF